MTAPEGLVQLAIAPISAAGCGPSLATRDVLIFQLSPDGLSLVGGSGRGLAWSGVVDLTFDSEPLAAGVCHSARPARVHGAGHPVRVVGPYWAKHAVMVPVGAEHLVVFGLREAPTEADAAYVSAAAHLVANLCQVAPAKLLEDELEVVQAIRELVQYQPDCVSETARHIALRAAEPLSCEVGAVLVRDRGRVITSVVTRDEAVRLDPEATANALLGLLVRVERGPLVELELRPDVNDGLGHAEGLVARFALPLGKPTPFGVLVVAHAMSRPRGFTSLCQRIGRSLAEVADTLLAQAISREALAEDRDRCARKAAMDPLTGLDNRGAWNEHLAAEKARHVRHPRPITVISVDLDNLKVTNDRRGHEAGDCLLRRTADLLRSQARSSDRIARVGGDEFLVLMPETDEEGGSTFMSRVRAAARRARLADGTGVGLSLGAATARDGEALTTVVQRADAAMYAAKKRRGRRSRLA